MGWSRVLTEKLAIRRDKRARKRDIAGEQINPKVTKRNLSKTHSGGLWNYTPEEEGPGKKATGGV